MDLDHFCTKLDLLDKKSAENALAILWFHDEKNPGVKKTAGELARTIRNAGLGNPNSSELATALKKTRAVLVDNKGHFSLKVLSRVYIRSWLEPILGAAAPKVEQDLGYLPQQVWKPSRGYIEKVCAQLNGCYQFQFYDAASVLIRRVVETLIIEAFEAKNREVELKDSSGNFFMLNGLINAANSTTNGIGLGRDAKKALADVKELGDRSAHNRRYNAVKADLEKVQSGVRCAVDELINIASLRST